MRKLIAFAVVVVVAVKLLGPFTITPYEVLAMVVAVPFLTVAFYGLLKAL